MRQPESVLRLKRKHAPGRSADVDVQALIGEQSVGRAAGGAAIAAVVLSIIWVYSAVMLDQFATWFSVIEGFFIGRAVQHFGQGIDWRFPVLAAIATVVTAWLGSFAAALLNTSREFYTPAIQLLSEVNWHTLHTFTIGTFGIQGTIYAVMGAAIAAFYANRRLNRNEAIALRRYREEGTS